MQELWKQRLHAYQKQVFKYLKYVLNDHFVLAMLFVLGGIALTYANFLKTVTVTDDYTWTKPIVILLLLIVLQLGRGATLLQPADELFLVPQEYQLPIYLKKAFHHALKKNLGLQIVLYAVLVPYLKIVLHTKTSFVIGLLVIQLLFKSLVLAKNYQAGYWAYLQKKASLVISLLIPLVVYSIAFYICVWFALTVTLCVVGYFMYRFKKERSKNVFAWRYMIQQENARLSRVYRVFALFTDVPNLQGKTKRRRYLDWMLPTMQQNNPYLYLEARCLVRNQEYSGLYLRLLILASALLIFVHDFWITLGVTILFNYLIVFQLIPLQDYYQENVFTHLYPVLPSVKLQGFKKLLSRIVLLTAVCFGIAALIGTQHILVGVLCGGIVLVESKLISSYYLKARIKKS